MEILLFNQYFSSPKSCPEKNFAAVPLNLLHLGTFLKSKGLSCKIYELGAFDDSKPIITGDRIRYGLSDEEIANIIDSEKPRIIGIGCMYSRHYIDVISIAKLVKEIDPAIKVVIGGNHATDLCDMVLKSQYFDFVVRGEGEITLWELSKAVLSGANDFSRINGIAYKKNGQVVKTENRELIPNLDDLPAVDYSMIELKKYFGGEDSPYNMRYPSFGIISSRGCPGNCVYCTVRAVWGRRWRAKSAKKTVDEIEFLKKNYGIQEIRFIDDSASVDKKRWNDICDEIIKRKLDIKWSTPNGIAHWTLDKPTLLKMKKSGCYRITFGIESGDREIRNFIRKTHSLKQARDLIRYANKIGMWTICTHIIGFPHETKKQMERTVRFAKISGTDFATFFSLNPMPTSDVYQCFKEEGLLNFDHIFNSKDLDMGEYERMNNMLFDGGAPTKYFQPKELKKITSDAYRSFIIYRAFTFLNPLRIIRKINSLEDLKYTVNLLLVGAKLLIKSFYKKSTTSLLR